MDKTSSKYGAILFIVKLAKVISNTILEDVLDCVNAIFLNVHHSYSTNVHSVRLKL